MSEYENTRKILDNSVERAATAVEHVQLALDKVQEAVDAWKDINDNRPPEQDKKIEVDVAAIFEVGAAAIQASTGASSHIDYYAKSRLAIGDETPTNYDATPHHTPARTEDRPQVPSAAGDGQGNQDQQNGESTNSGPQPGEETPTGRPSLLPTYTPMDVANEIARIDQWRSGEAISSIHEPSASISLTAADQQLLEAYIRANPDKQYFVHQQGKGLIGEGGRAKKFDDPQVRAVFTQTANAMHSHMQYDLSRAKVTQDRPSAIHFTVGQYTTSEDAVPHMDADDKFGDDLIRYVATPVGPTTQFADGSFAPSEFRESGDMHPTERQIVWSSSMPKHITRFRGTSVHQSPTADTPTPRVFMSTNFSLLHHRRR